MSISASIVAATAALVFAVQATQTGTWTATSNREVGKVILSIHAEPNSQWGRSYAFNELQGLGGADGPAQFSLAREAGTVAFEGSFREGKGAGHFTFTPAPDFAEQMARLGYPE